MGMTNEQFRDALTRTLVEEHGVDLDVAEAKAGKVTVLSEADGQVRSIGLWIGGTVPRGADPVAWLAGEIARQAQQRNESKETENEPPENEYEAARRRKLEEQKAKRVNRMDLRDIAGRRPQEEQNATWAERREKLGLGGQS